MSDHPLAEWRKAKKLTQAELADELDVTRETIARWETGARKIGAEHLPEVRKRTKLSLADLRPDLCEVA